MNIGENIKKYRKEKKLTQAQLSELCGVPVISLGRYERGERNPNIETLTKIATVLQVPIDILCGLKLEPIIEPKEGFILGYTNEKTGETIFDSVEEYLQTQMAKEVLPDSTFEVASALKTLMFYTSNLNLTFITDEGEAKIKLKNFVDSISITLTEDEFFKFIKRLNLYIESEIKYINHLEDEPMDFK